MMEKMVLRTTIFKGCIDILEELAQLLDDIGLIVKFWVGFRDNQTGRLTNRVEIFTEKLINTKKDVS